MEMIKKYVYEVYKESSFTKAAQKLFISQPALSSAIAKYEKSIGFRIFDRSKNPLKVTSEGRVLIESIESIINIEASVKQQIALMGRQHKSEISIGGSTSGAYYLMPKICALFHKEHPSALIKIDLGNNNSYDNFETKLQNGTLDLVIDYIPLGDSMESTVICEENMVVIVPQCMISDGLKQYAMTYDELNMVHRARAVKDVSLFGDISFIAFSQGSVIMRSKMEDIFGEYHTIPLIVSNYRNIIIHYNFVKEGIGAIITDIGAAKAFFSNSDKVSYFLLDNEKAKREIYLTTSSKNLHSPLIKRFIEITKAVCGNLQ